MLRLVVVMGVVMLACAVVMFTWFIIMHACAKKLPPASTPQKKFYCPKCGWEGDDEIEHFQRGKPQPCHAWPIHNPLYQEPIAE
jgi:hypothetical protein